MTLEQKLKQELFNAEMDYKFKVENYRKNYPNGTNFCYEKVNAKQASAAMSLEKAEGILSTLSYFFKTTLKGEELEMECFRLIDNYENAENEEEYLQAESEYYALHTLRTEF